MADAAAADRKPPYLIRPARPGDVPALVAIENAAFDPAHYGGLRMTARSFLRHAAGKNILLVAVQNTPAAPVAGYGLGLVKKGSPYVRFYSLAVGAGHGGRGAGWRLFEGIENAARERGYRGVRLEIREDNDRLLARYRRQGYDVFARVADYYSDGAGAIRMIKDFVPAGLE